MALTLDDYPLASSSGVHRERCDEIWSAIREAVRDVPATWFVVASELDEGALRFLDNVEEIGNHTASHLALTDVSADEFLRDVDDAERVLARFLRTPKLFRYPYLREGDTQDKQRVVRDGLAARGYVIAPVTIAPRDWEYDAQPLSDELLHRYVLHVEEEAQRAYERARDIPHILVLHVNALNAIALAQVIANLQRQWRFVSLRDALAHPIYQRIVPPSHIGRTLLEAI